MIASKNAYNIEHLRTTGKISRAKCSVFFNTSILIDMLKIFYSKLFVRNYTENVYNISFITHKMSTFIINIIQNARFQMFHYLQWSDELFKRTGSYVYCEWKLKKVWYKV